MRGARAALAGIVVAALTVRPAAGEDAAPPSEPAPARPAISYAGPRAVEAALRALADPERARLETYGTSAKGRPLLLLRIGRGDLPQVLVHGGCGPRDAAGTTAALDFARRVLGAPGAAGGAVEPSPLDRVGFLVAPAPNPDALATFLGEGEGGAGRGGGPTLSTLGGPDVDRDHDGRLGEDGPDDLDGDGEVLWMRRADPAGTFGVKESPARDDGKRTGDPRLLEALGVDARRPASYERLDEGKDDDGDGDVNEDAPGIDLRRHFPGVWEEVGPWPGDGHFPGFAPEVRALLELSHETESLVAWYAFASEGPYLERASERGEAAEADKDLYEALAGAWKKACGLETKKASERGGGNPGSDLDWAARHLGLLAVRVPVWRIPKQEGNAREREVPDELDWLLWDDARVAQGAAAGFVPWKAFAHPTLGEVEIGGWRRFSRFEPPPDLLGAAVAAVSAVPAAHADFVPRLAVSVDVKPLGAGLHEVRARVRNVGGGATDPKSAENARRHMPVRMAFRAADGAKVVAGDPVGVAGVVAAGAVSSAFTWTVQRGGAGDLGVVEAWHRAAGRADAKAVVR